MSFPSMLVENSQEDELVFLFANDSDDFNRWEAGQQLLRSLALRLLDAHKEARRPHVLLPGASTRRLSHIPLLCGASTIRVLLPLCTW